MTYGPLLDFTVEGKPMGSRFQMPATGGTVEVIWRVASVTIPMSRVELIVNGEITESREVSSQEATGHWSVKVEASCWLALLVRGHYEDKPEIITAHSSPVMIGVEGSPMLAAADAVTILEQIEGAMIYLDTIGTRADDATYKRMRNLLTAVLNVRGFSMLATCPAPGMTVIRALGTRSLSRLATARLSAVSRSPIRIRVGATISSR